METYAVPEGSAVVDAEPVVEAVPVEVETDVGPPAFVAFFTAVWPDLAGYASSLRPDGADLAQEALTRVYARWGLVRDPRAYAFRVVTNLARDAWKAAAREAPDPPPSEAPDGEVLDAVRRLKPIHRDVLLLHYWADLPVAEIARVLRRPTGTIKWRLAAAREALASSWEETP